MNKTGIEWTEYTWNPWQGCTKVSAGCKNCYMFRDKERFGQTPNKVVKSSAKTFKKPLSIKEPAMIFTCSWSDWFHEDADAWRDEAWEIIKATPQHTYQILTKRADRLLTQLPKDWDGGKGYPNVWLGISAEDQQTFDSRIFELSRVKATVRFISAEPLIGDLYIQRRHWENIDWLIVGGESGDMSGKYAVRECEEDWLFSLMMQAATAQKPIFVKQLGTFLAAENGIKGKGDKVGDIAKLLQVKEEDLRAFPNV